MTTRRAITVLAVLPALALPATAEAFWQYRGHVEGPGRTTIQLVVRHRHGHVKGLLTGETGRLRLACEHGRSTGRLNFGDAGFGLPTPPGGRGGRGHFSESGSGGTIEFGPHGRNRDSFSYSIRGRIERSRARGMLHLKVNRHGRKGKCDSGLLRWHARFVPRSR
jgi:hypothetical protein